MKEERTRQSKRHSRKRRQKERNEMENGKITSKYIAGLIIKRPRPRRSKRERTCQNGREKN